MGSRLPHLQVPVLLQPPLQLLPLPLLLLCTACTTMKLFFNAGLHETNASSTTFPSLHAMPMLGSYVAWIQFDS